MTEIFKKLLNVSHQKYTLQIVNMTEEKNKHVL